MQTQRQVKSADRVLEVLELMAQLQRPVSIKDIIGHLGYPQSSTQYLLKSLCDTGYLNFNKVGHTYFPTSRVKNLGSWIEGYLPENTSVFEAMSALRRQFGETVAIGTQSDLHLQYLKALESDFTVRYHIQEGGRRPLLEAAMGWMLLSQFNEDAVDTICRRTNQLVGSKIYQSRDVMRDLARIEQDGYCLLEDKSIPYHAATIAMRLPSLFNGQPLVVGVGGMLDRILHRKDEIISFMCREITRL